MRFQELFHISIVKNPLLKKKKSELEAKSKRENIDTITISSWIIGEMKTDFDSDRLLEQSAVGFKKLKKSYFV